MIRFLTAGESHGKALTVIVEGFPSNLNIEADYINFHLKRRQAGYGRGLRMKIESDKVEILSGIRDGKTIGSPICMMIENKDFPNWESRMDIGKLKKNVEKISIPRPGHADLSGTLKYDFSDIRNSIERSSARETAARTAAGTIARRFLEEFGISIGSFVESIGGIFSKKNFFRNLIDNDLPDDFTAWSLSENSDRSEVRVLDEDHEKKIINKIRLVKKKGDTVGGTFVTAASGLPPGLGSFMHYDRKLNAAIAQSIMSINAVKGVEIGNGFGSSQMYGSEVQDEIFFNHHGSISRNTNHLGGIEGGISTGMPLIVRSAMKPIATLMFPLKSIDLQTMTKVDSRRERSDFTAVPACAVISEAMLAWTISEFFIIKFGGDSMYEIKSNFNSYLRKLKKIRKNS